MVRFSSSEVVGFDAETIETFNGIKVRRISGHLSALTWCEGVLLAKAEVAFTSCHKENNQCLTVH